MDVTRRHMLGFASVAGAATFAGPLLAAQTAAVPGRFAEAVRRIKAFAAADLADKGFPGMTVALVGPNGFASTFAVGLADLDRAVPATPNHLFQIGSISKSLTAMALFVLAQRGMLDLDARVQDLLQEYPLPPEPITLTQLLDHSSGIPNNLEDAAHFQVPGGRLWTGFLPGSRYSYCNLGYALLGAVIERVTGVTFAVALETLVLRPLGMNRAVPLFRISDRAAFATGHARFREDVPWLPKARLAPARWFDFVHAAGSVAATGDDMVRYLQFVGQVAAGKGVPLFSDALAERFRTPTIASSPPGARYGNGLISLDVEGRPCFRHTGGILGFSSAFTLDKETGVGCYASVNVGGAGNYRPTEITEYALPLVRAAGNGSPLPAVGGPKPPALIKDAARFTGRWFSADGSELVIAERGGALSVTSRGLERPLRSGGESGFVTDHPALDPNALVFESNASVLRLGNRLFGRHSAPAAQPPSPRLAALTGVYYSPGAWSSRPRVFAIGERLFVGTEEVVETSDGSWRFKSPNLASERLWFQHPIGGRPQVLNFSGSLFNRVHDRSL